MLLDHLEHPGRVADGGLDLSAVTHDPHVAEQPLHVARSEARHDAGIETGEGNAEVLALAQDRDPCETGLETLEADLLEQAHIVGDRTRPFAVVVVDVQRIVAGPPAPRSAVTSDTEPVAGHGVTTGEPGVGG